MSVSIELPCGCTINEAFVISMCLPHVQELTRKQLVAKADYDRFERMWDEATGHTSSEPSSENSNG